MTTATISLTDFILQRIAEDEAVAREVVESDQHMQRLTEYPLDEDWSFWADTDGGRPSVSIGAARVLAECEAKRRIISVEIERYGEDLRATDVLLCLALPYADHPEFRPEWKP